MGGAEVGVQADEVSLTSHKPFTPDILAVPDQN